MSSMFMQASGLAASGHHLPLPYTPRIDDTSVVSSSDSFGSDGVAMTSDTFSRLS